MLVSGYVCAGLSILLGVFSIPAMIIGIVNMTRGHVGHGLAQIIIGCVLTIMYVGAIVSMVNH